MTRDELFDFLAEAQAAGLVSEVGCATHGTLEMSEDEQDGFEDGWDPCMFAVRVWPLS